MSSESREEWVAAIAELTAADPTQWNEAFSVALDTDFAEAAEIVRLLGMLDYHSPDTGTLADLIDRAAALVSKVCIREADMQWETHDE